MKFYLKLNEWGTWVAQLVKGPNLDFGSGHDLTISGTEPNIGLYTDSMKPVWNWVSLPHSPSLPLFPSVSNKLKKKSKNKKQLNGKTKNKTPKNK